MDHHSGKTKELTLGTGSANLYTLVFLIPLLLFIGLPYYAIWTEQFTVDKFRGYLEVRDQLTYIELGLYLAIWATGIVMHELIHGLAWAIFSKGGWKSIKFGMHWKFLTPYCHCKLPVTVREYRIGALMPAILLGIFPSVVAMFTGSLLLLGFGFFFTFAAAGDFMLLWMLRHEKSDDQALDHPDKIGCVIYRNS